MIAAGTMQSPYVFVSERGSPLSVAGYQRMVARAGEAARFAFLVHSHMLRHGCGYKLANDGQDTRAIQHYLGHRSIARPCAIPHWRRIGSKGSGKTNANPVRVNGSTQQREEEARGLLIATKGAS